MAALSFCYAPPLSGQYTRYAATTTKDDTTILSNLEDTCQKISTSRGCQISVVTTTQSKNTTCIDYNLSLTGSAQSLMEARGDLLRHCPLEVQLTLSIPPFSTTTTTTLSNQLEELEKELNVKINVISEKENYSSLVSENPMTIEIIGNHIQVEQCRVRLLVLLDEMKSFTTEIVRLPLKLQYLICGRKRAGLLPIIEETSTNIYFPSPFTDDTHESNNENETEPAIYITGESSNVSRVKDMLNKLAVQKAKSMYHKDTALYARKMDWLLLHRRDELRKIMHDNGAYIEFPAIGSGDNRVTVYAENRVNAERTLRALNFQACTIYEACFYFNNRDGAIYDSAGGHTFFDSTSNLSGLVSQLSQVSGSEVIYKTEPGCIEVLGAERAIRNVYQRLQEMQFLQVFHQYTIFRVESSNDQRDFISGKKNGKINKIMKTSGAKIRFMPFINDYNFIIEVESTSFTKALDGLTLLQEELPAEISFYVPESYHKRIIGVGGKNIQRIMKKYGVYVKFSNTEEFASLGGYYNNEDNVVARTPMKNQINLDNLRHAVMELIHPKDRDYVVEYIVIPFGLHRSLIHEYQDTFINEEMIKKTNTHVLWPDAELANNNVGLLGPEAHMSIAFKLMETIVPEPYDLHVPLSAQFTAAISSDSFEDKVVLPLRQEFNVVVEPLVLKADTKDRRDGLIRLNLKRDQLENALSSVLDCIIQYLLSQDVELYENTTAEKLAAQVNKSQIIRSQHFIKALQQQQQPPPSVIGGQSSVAMMRSASDTIFNHSSNSSNNLNANDPSPPQAYQFFNFQQNDAPVKHTLDTNWTPPQMQQSGPIPSVSTSGQSTHSNPQGTGDTIRAIFDAPMDLTDQERVVLSNYRYQRMSMPPASNFGFPQTVPNAPSAAVGDIWSTPSQMNRRSGGFATGGQAGGNASGRNNYASATSNEAAAIQHMTDNMQHMGLFNDASSNGFYPGMMQQSNNDFNPYNDSNTTGLKSSQSMPEPLLEQHFNTGRTPFQTSPNTFHASTQPQQQQQPFSHYGNFTTRQSNPGGGFVNNNNHHHTSPEHNHHQPHTFYPNNDELDAVHSMLDFPTISGSSGFDPRRQPPDQDNKGGRPPPGIDI